jgi:hypothetical protein
MDLLHVNLAVSALAEEKFLSLNLEKTRMSSYEQIEGFEYWNKEAWKEFVKDYILPIHTLSNKLLKLREEILSKTEGRKLSDLDDNLLKFLLGGINEEGDYEKNSLALFIKNAFGIYVDSKQYVALAKEGINPLAYVKVEVSTETGFVKFLRNLSSLSSGIVSKVKLETTGVKEVEELIREPEKILEVLRELYEKVLQVTANYSYYTFFTVSIRNLPFFYLTKAYPKLMENFDELREFLGLGVIFEPETEVQNIKEKCTIWGHVEGGLCNLIFNLNNLIWESINPSSNLSPIFGFISPSFKDLKEEYLNKAKEKLKLIGWKIPEVDFGTIREWYCQFWVSGVVVRGWSSHEYVGYWRSSVPAKYYEGKSLLKVLNDFSPALFLHFLYLKKTDNRLELRTTWSK